ncbi:hypothetical protein [Microcoleus sp. OTE_8_concoct_300]|uniref:hypothetical protein n=1 Tax=Microcoleus sp. OTE_8_concoct_300 TaxID=2964710 RepID=UPI00403F8FAE
MPVPQENLFFVERAEEPVLDNGATSQVKQIYSVISCHVNQAAFCLGQSKIYNLKQYNLIPYSKLGAEKGKTALASNS